MRDRVLLGRRVEAERPAARRFCLRLEDRVVAEARAAARRHGDPAAADAPSEPDARVARLHEREDADVLRRALLRRLARERGQELPIVVVVGRVRTGVATRPDARSAAKRVNLEPRVISEGRQAGCGGREPCLELGVGLEGLAVLDDVAGDTEVVER